MNNNIILYEQFRNFFKELEDKKSFLIENHKGQPYIRFKSNDEDHVIILKNTEELQLFTNKKIVSKIKVNELKYEDQRWLEEKFVLPVENIIDKNFKVETDLKDLLKKVYGFDQFRDNQEEIIYSIMSGKDTVVLKPTGAGKSLCFQVPALAMEGVAIVISPLISLMQNQVMNLKQLGVKAEFINSTLSPDQYRNIRENIKNIKLLYISPERFNMPEFLQWLKSIKISFFAIDEAHCISRWGHDFRPDYTQLHHIKEQFNKPIIALTATADLRTRSDIPIQLRMEEYNLYISNFDRPNIKILVEEKNDYKKQLIHYINQFKGESGIVYCLSRKTVEETAKFLQSKGYKAYPYHAGIPHEKKTEHQEIFMMEENVIIVATIAFGMGIDKPNVRFVIHVNMPQNLESYYQEIGRAGRDGDDSTAILLYGMKDFIQRQNMIYQGSSNQKIAEMGKLQEMLAFSDTLSCKRNYLLKYFGDDSPSTCGNCSSCLSTSEKVVVTGLAHSIIQAVKETEEFYGIGYISLLLKGSSSKEVKENHKKLPSYNTISESEAIIKKTIRQLIVLGNLKIDLDSGYNNLKIVSEEILFDISIKKDGKEAEDDENSSENKVMEKNSLSDLLRSKRLEIASTNRIPPYVVFNDKSLKDLVKRKPTTKKALLNVFGWGEKKVEKYGDIFIEIIINNKDK